MKKIAALTLSILFATALYAQAPSGTYVPKNEIAKSLSYEKFVFSGKKVKLYVGVSGISTGVSFEYDYTLSGKILTIKEGAGSVEFTYDRAKDEISLMEGAFGTEGAVWMKEGANTNQTNKTSTNVSGNQGNSSSGTKNNNTNVPQNDAAKSSSNENTAKKPNNSSIKYKYDIAKKCALYSALAYDETRIVNMSASLSSHESTQDYIDRNYKNKAYISDVYYQGKRDDVFDFQNEHNPWILQARLRYDGYENIESKNYGDNDKHNISYTFAYKIGDAKKGEGNDICFAVILRGTDGVEWFGNMDIWENENKKSVRHYSFQKANEELQKAIRAYLNKEVFRNKKIHFLITGHSRGAAVANLLAVDLSDGAIPGIETVEAYTFATPNNTTNFSTKYTNIFNFCFDDDFVPQVPLDKWGYGKSGIPYTACAEHLYNIDIDVKGFKPLMDTFIQRSDKKGRDASLIATQKVSGVLQVFAGLARSVDKYYNTTPLLDMKGLDIPNQISLYRYMVKYVAQAAVDEANDVYNIFGTGSAGWCLYQQSQDDKSTVYEIADFLIDGESLLKAHSAYYVNDTHQAFTYYYALLRNGFKLKK